MSRDVTVSNFISFKVADHLQWTIEFVYSNGWGATGSSIGLLINKSVAYLAIEDASINPFE